MMPEKTIIPLSELSTIRMEMLKGVANKLATESELRRMTQTLIDRYRLPKGKYTLTGVRFGDDPNNSGFWVDVDLRHEKNKDLACIHFEGPPPPEEDDYELHWSLARCVRERSNDAMTYRIGGILKL